MKEYMIYFKGKPILKKLINGKANTMDLFVKTAKELGLTFELIINKTWIEKQYDRLLLEFEKEEFTGKQARIALNYKSTVVSVIISELKKQGLAKARLHPTDSRLRYYRLL